MNAEEELKRVSKELEQVKNEFAAMKNRVNNANAISASNAEKFMEVQKSMEEFEEKFKNNTKIISSIRDEFKKSGGESASSAVALDEEMIADIMAKNIPLDAIKVYIDKHLKQSDILQQKSSSKPKKKGGSFFKMVFVFMFLGALLFGAYRFYDSNKLTKRIIPKGTFYFATNQEGQKKLLSDIEMMGKFKDLQTKQGIKRFFISTKVVKGKEIEYRFLVKPPKGKK